VSYADLPGFLCAVTGPAFFRAPADNRAGIITDFFGKHGALRVTGSFVRCSGIVPVLKKIFSKTGPSGFRKNTIHTNNYIPVTTVQASGRTDGIW
jgi:hypothetical protein